jgi:hypothetical protein
MRIRKYVAGLTLSLMASSAFAQASTITFDVVFNKLLQASGANLSVLYDSTNDPLGFGSTSPAFSITGTVQLSAVPSSTYLTNAGPNQITLNGSFTDAWPGVSPPATWLTHTYNNAVFDLYQPGAKFANNFAAANPQPIFIGTSSTGLLSDHGVAAHNPPGSPCPFPRGIFPPFQNCASTNPALTMGSNFQVFSAGSALYPTLGDLGQHDLIGGSYSVNQSVTGIGHDNGLDGFYFSGQLCAGGPNPLCSGGQIAPGGVVRVLMTSSTSNTWYVLEGQTTVVPAPAAVWLLGSALGLLGYRRARLQAARRAEA